MSLLKYPHYPEFVSVKIAVHVERHAVHTVEEKVVLSATLSEGQQIPHCLQHGERD